MGYNVLVVDDEPLIRQVLSDLLEDEGHRVSTAPDGEAALDTVAKHIPDLLLADVMMPRLGGLGLSRSLRERGYDFPIVLMSAVYGEVDIPG
nr:response regulator [Chloroflexota bacterium]